MFVNAGPNLFDRIPTDLFSPLTGEHARRYMNMLTRLHEDFFGPDGEIAPDDGFPRRRITEVIESYLRDAPWPTVEGDERQTPLEIQAQEIFARLRDTGWLTEDRIDVRVLITMKPIVQHLLGLLIQFAEHGPEYIGGTVQMIYTMLKSVVEDPEGQAAGFHQSAQTARSMFETLAATKVRAQETMERLAEFQNISEYANAYFRDYIADLYIADYHNLRTVNHPLRHRHDIVSLVTELREDPQKRALLLKWYQDNAKRLGDPEVALEKDISRIMRFNSIEQHLDRLDSAMNRVNTQALNYLKYATRTRGQIEALLDCAIAHVASSDQPQRLHFFCGIPFSELRLKMPKQPVEGDERTPITKKTPSPEMLALYRLNQMMRANRQLSDRDIAKYVERFSKGRPMISSDELEITSIKDFCAFLSLTRKALFDGRAQHTGGQASMFRVRRDKGAITSNGYITTERFIVERQAAKNGKSHE